MRWTGLSLNGTAARIMTRQAGEDGHLDRNKHSRYGCVSASIFSSGHKQSILGLQFSISLRSILGAMVRRYREDTTIVAYGRAVTHHLGPTSSSLSKDKACMGSASTSLLTIVRAV